MKSCLQRVAKLGLEHLSVANTKNNIAVVHAQQGQHSIALQMRQESLDIKIKVLGLDHPLAADTRNKCALDSNFGSLTLMFWSLTAMFSCSIGAVYFSQGKHDDALTVVCMYGKKCSKFESRCLAWSTRLRPPPTTTSSSREASRGTRDA